MAHKVYKSIVNSIKKGKITEPFTKKDFKRTCPGFAEGTYNNFLNKHRLGNTGGDSELLKKYQVGNLSALDLSSMGCKEI